MGNSANNFRCGPHRSGGQLVGWGWTRHLGSVHEDHDSTKAVFSEAVSAAKTSFTAFDSLLSGTGHPWRAAYLALSQADKGELRDDFALYGS